MRSGKLEARIELRQHPQNEMMMGPAYNNILIVRTDRVGDVVLTTPAITAIKKAWPKANVSILVSKATREIVEGNPSLDEIMVDDTQGVHRGPGGFFKLIGEIRRRHFDLAIIMHTKKRTNLLCFLAGIPIRVGYVNDKFGFLLTHKIPDDRPAGLKHEYQYCLEVLEHLPRFSIQSRENNGDRSQYAAPEDLSHQTVAESVVTKQPSYELVFPLKESSERWAQYFLGQYGLGNVHPLIAIHPDASCVSKRWPVEHFSTLAKELVKRYPAQILVVGSSAARPLALNIQDLSGHNVWDCTGMTSLSQLASLLKRCHLLVSNDSGPVHVAVAVKTPVVSIFGRNQDGLSPTRWRPLGPRDSYVHKNVGCEVCLAHNCVINFECLRAITPEDVLSRIDALFKL